MILEELPLLMHVDDMAKHETCSHCFRMSSSSVTEGKVDQQLSHMCAACGEVGFCSKACMDAAAESSHTAAECTALKHSLRETSEW